MMLPGNHLRSFVAVAEHGSYTHAAEHLFLSQPAVYQHVKQLEAALGTRLVEQHGKRVVLTQHGKVVESYARRIREQESDLLQYLADDESLEQGEIKIAAGTTAGEFLLPRIAVGFRRQYPGIRIIVAVLERPESVDRQVASRDFDLGFHSQPSESPGVVMTGFLHDELIGIAPPGHRFATAGRPIPARALATEPLITFSRVEPPSTGGYSMRLMTNRWLAESEVQPEVGLSIGSLEGIKTAVRHGAGVALVSRFSMREDDTSLATFRLKRAPERTFVMVAREHGWESNVVRRFREYALSLDWLSDDEAAAGAVEKGRKA
jgi:DNA-binding transcriptional LysR family regulator